MQVFNNTPAYSVWKNYTSNVDNLRQSMSRLASGLRIGQAGDDPAGLAISERLRAQYRNSAAAASNVENKINYLQTADSWLQKVHDIMGRMAELSILANDGTKAPTDRNNLQREFAQMQREIRRITSGATAAAKFNGLYLFRGGSGVPSSSTSDGDGLDPNGFASLRLQIGPDGDMVFEEEPINLTATNFTMIGNYKSFTYGSVNMTLLASTHTAVAWASLISGNELSISTQTLAQGAVDKMNVGIDYISDRRSIIGAEMNRMQQTLSGLRNYEENIRATESRIRDVDVAWETTQFSKYQILTQLGMAMLSQANALPNSVMSLLG